MRQVVWAGVSGVFAGPRISWCAAPVKAWHIQEVASAAARTCCATVVDSRAGILGRPLRRFRAEGHLEECWDGGEVEWPTGGSAGMMAGMVSPARSFWLVFRRFSAHRTHFACRRLSGRGARGGDSIEVDRPAHVVGQVLQPDPRLGAGDADAA